VRAGKDGTSQSKLVGFTATGFQELH